MNESMGIVSVELCEVNQTDKKLNSVGLKKEIVFIEKKEFERMEKTSDNLQY